MGNPLIPQTGSRRNLIINDPAALREEGKEEHNPEPPEGDYHSPSSDDSLSPYIMKQINDDNFQGDFRKIRAPTYDREVNMAEKVEE